MSLSKSLLIVLMFFSLIFKANAGDFSWMKQLSAEARLDSSGFHTRLSARFNLPELKIRAVLNDVHNAADAYMVLRLGEISGAPVDSVMQRYQSNKGKGWGSLARSLGIKPGSRAFHRLKQGHDLKEGNNNSSQKGKSKRNGNGNHNSKGKGQGRGKGK